MLFIVSGGLWLLIASLLTLIVHIKLLAPDWLGGWRWLTYGRVYPMAQNAFVYGWLSNAGLGVLLWIWARLMKSGIHWKPFLLVSGGLWNTGVALGLVGIMTGFSRGTLWLDMPMLTTAMLLLGALSFSASLFKTWLDAPYRNLYVSVWYLGASLIWLPALLFTTLLPLDSGLAGALYTTWFGHSMLYLWILPVGLGAVYYLIPRTTGKPIFSYPLSLPGFMAYALFACWSSASPLIGGPAPFWLTSTSIAFSLMMLIPVSIIAFNVLKSLRVQNARAARPDSVRFFRFGAISFTVFGVLASLAALRSLNRFTQFTFFEEAIVQLGLYGFASMVAFGSAYYILQHFTGRVASQSNIIRFHFLLAAIGLALFLLANVANGLSQGAAFLNADVPLTESLGTTWVWLSLLGVLVLSTGHLLFGYMLFNALKK
jgi:cytochrome c oxidase cbb3-type subunit 1